MANAHRETKEPQLPFRWLGGRPELDFANTVAWLVGAEGRYQERVEYERLTSYERLIEWSFKAGMLPVSDDEGWGEPETEQPAYVGDRGRGGRPRPPSWLRQAYTGWGPKPEAEQPAYVLPSRTEEKASVLARALVLRRSVHALFTDLFHHRSTHPDYLEAFNNELEVANSHVRIASSDAAFHWHWVDAKNSLDCILWPIVWQASHSLTSGDSGRVRECSGDACGFLFFDSSKGGRRRWCDMSHCGNRAKVRRHYQRHRGRTP